MNPLSKIVSFSKLGSSSLKANVVPNPTRRFASNSVPIHNEGSQAKGNAQESNHGDRNGSKSNQALDARNAWNQKYNRHRGLMHHRNRGDFFDWGLSPFFKDFHDARSNWVNSFFNDRAVSPFSGQAGDILDWKPHTDMVSTKDGFEITVELPGVAKDNVSIQIADDIITIKGEKKVETSHGEEGSENYHKERSYGSFVRKFSLPSEGIDAKSVSADFKDGVLRVKIPKGQREPTHTVNIN